MKKKCLHFFISAVKVVECEWVRNFETNAETM